VGGGVPGQPAMQAYSGRVELVVTRRVIGSARVEFYEWSLPLVLLLLPCCVVLQRVL